MVAGEAAKEHAASRFVLLPFVNNIVPLVMAIGGSGVPVSLFLQSVAINVVVEVTGGCHRA